MEQHNFHGPKVQVGKPAPSFKLDAYIDGGFRKVSLDDYKGKWVVVFFYPADFTFVCPTELGDLADNYETFKKMNVEILAVSTDSHFSHKAWHDSSPMIKKIRFPMLADRTAEMSRDYGVLIEEVGETHRGTFIINPDGDVLSYEINHDCIGRSTGEILRKLQAAQFVRENGNVVCPMNWKPGQETLTPGPELVGKI